MPIQKFTISNDPDFYEAWPDMVLTDAGKLVCVFSECTPLGNRRRISILRNGTDIRLTEDEATLLMIR